MFEERHYLKNPDPKVLESFESDQRKGVPPPPREKPVPEGAALIDLVPPEAFSDGGFPLLQAIRQRESRREFAKSALSLTELSFLLWACQGVKEIGASGVWARRTVPSGGCRHPLETYLVARAIEGLSPGLYRYVALRHKLLRIKDGLPAKPDLGELCYGQSFVNDAAVTFVWSAVPYRTEWRYGPDSLKDILIGCGHACQNLYLACEALGAGACAILAYDQEAMDRYLGLDGEEEMTLYCAPVGKVKKD